MEEEKHYSNEAIKVVLKRKIHKYNVIYSSSARFRTILERLTDHKLYMTSKFCELFHKLACQ